VVLCEMAAGRTLAGGEISPSPRRRLSGPDFGGVTRNSQLGRNTRKSLKRINRKLGYPERPGASVNSPAIRPHRSW
jgi:hypothetical protein